MTDDMTQPDDTTRQFEEEQETSVESHADRMPTDDEEEAAERTEPLTEEAAERYKEATERGANVKGEGQV